MFSLKRNMKKKEAYSGINDSDYSKKLKELYLNMENENYLMNVIREDNDVMLKSHACMILCITNESRENLSLKGVHDFLCNDVGISYEEAKRITDNTTEKHQRLQKETKHMHRVVLLKALKLIRN